MKALGIILLLVFISFFSLSELNAQPKPYQAGLGLRGGFSSGITFKYFLSDVNALEGILTTRWRGFNITGLYEWQRPVFDVDNLYWFYGGGAHLGFWGGYEDHPWFDDTANYSVVGIDGIIGLEYDFAEVPVSLGLDWKPAFNFVGYTGFWADNLAISIRFLFR